MANEAKVSSEKQKRDASIRRNASLIIVVRLFCFVSADLFYDYGCPAMFILFDAILYATKVVVEFC